MIDKISEQDDINIKTYAKIYNFRSFLKLILKDVNVLAFLISLDKTFHITQPLY